MLLEFHEKLSADQAFTATAVCTNTYKLGAAGRDIGRGPVSLGIRWTVKVAASFGGTQTYELQIVSATAGDGTTGSVVLITTGTIATADVAARLALGDVIDLPLPPGVIPATATHITGKLVGANSPTVTLDAYLVDINKVPSWAPFTAAVTVI